MKCPGCSTLPADWNASGSPASCAFESGSFSDKNWNCQTMNALRDVAESAFEVTEPSAHPAAVAVWAQDQSCAILNNDSGDFLVLGWYKRRGNTETCILVTGCGPPVMSPTLEQLAPFLGATPR